MKSDNPVNDKVARSRPADTFYAKTRNLQENVDTLFLMRS